MEGVIIIKDLHTRQGVTEVKLGELESTVDKIEQLLNAKTDENDVKIIIEQLIKEKELVTKSDLDYYQEKIEANIKKTQVMMIKWVIGTGLSAIMAITGIIGLFN
ncbi:hypothetical protein [Aquibacillus saliphilus]|uniref:hypothetical protein n=1 Tax=Aquibacillus saliphilus TaxID=1909422 RepID=UPI001CF08689|nr:hypothetical protein [Aquibacillus saliphilus]